MIVASMCTLSKFAIVDGLAVHVSRRVSLKAIVAYTKTFARSSMFAIRVVRAIAVVKVAWFYLLTVLSISTVTTEARAAGSTRASVVALCKQATLAVVIFAWVDLRAGLAIATIALVAFALVLTRACHNASRLLCTVIQ